MKTNKAKTIPEAQLQEFMSLVQQGHTGMAAWVKAGELLVAMLDVNPDVFELLLAANKDLRYEFLQTLELLGRKKLLPELLLDNSMGAARLAKLPYSKQVEFYNNGVDVVVKRNGLFALERKPVSKLTFKEVFTVFDGNKDRGPAAQQKCLVDGESVAKKRNQRYVIDGEMIQFFSGSKFSIKELHALLGSILEGRKPAEIKSLQGTMQQNQVRPRMAA